MPVKNYVDHIAWALRGKDKHSLGAFVNEHTKWTRDEKRRLEIGFFRAGGNGAVEFLVPQEGEGTVSRFLEKRGPGFHHVCIAVPDVYEAFHTLSSAGVEVIGEPELGAEGRPVFFVHPRETGGILLEFIQAEED